MNADALLNSQPGSFATEKLSDRLFTKTSLRCITASSVRERERLICLFKGIDRAIHSTGVEYEFYKKAMRRKKELFEKKKNRPAIDVSHKKPEPIENKRRSHRRAETVPTTLNRNQHVRQLQLYNRVLMFKQGAERHQSIASDADSVFGGTDLDDDVFTENGDVMSYSMSHRNSKLITGIGYRGGGNAGFSTAGTQQRKGYDQPRSVEAIPKRSIDVQGMHQDQIKRIVMKLHQTPSLAIGPNAMTEQERKVYDLIQDNNDHRKTTLSGLRGVSGGRRLVSTPKSINSAPKSAAVDDAFQRLSLVLADDFEVIDEQKELSDTDSEKEKKIMQKLVLGPTSLPPIHRQATFPLVIRKWDLAKKNDDAVEDDWEELRYCRYLRAPEGMLKQIKTVE